MTYTSKDILKSALGEFFRDYLYKDAVTNLRRAIKEKANYRDQWESVVRLVVNRELEPGEPLYLIHQSAITTAGRKLG